MTDADFSRIDIRIDVDATDDPIVTVDIVTTIGVLSTMGVVMLNERSLTIEGTHVAGLTPGRLGAAGLRRLMQKVMESLDVDEIIVAGAVRTTGARPGHRPRPLRFSRKAAPVALPNEPR